ncbi:hypothetical protein QVD17_00084 [Tagetes erecta]|uniref:Uncharacterized protein n=1 Tax=Tagetes erecta TaxID=13708 RepID=A0AAD8L2P0_TARER|nr:hypothetical protein QVD17_00084 [Tagetes erecta]
MGKRKGLHITSIGVSECVEDHGEDNVECHVAYDNGKGDYQYLNNLRLGIISYDKFLGKAPSLIVHPFYFILTTPDMNTHGGSLVLIKQANEGLPALDMTHTTPTQGLVAKDLHGT